MPVLTVWLVNKAGGLIYQRTVADTLHPRLGSNDYLVLASTFQSVHAIASKVSPLPGSGGIDTIEWQGADPFHLHCLHTPTGLKILVTASPSQPNCPAILRRIYELYADFALKSPFHTPEMPIRCELFDAGLLRLLQAT